MKVALISPHYPPKNRGGVADYAKILAESLARVVSVDPIINRSFMPSTAESISDELVNKNIDAVIMPYTPNLFGWRNLFPPLFLYNCKKRKIKSLTIFHELFLPEYKGLLQNVIQRLFNILKDLYCLKNTDYPVVTFYKRASDIQWLSKNKVAVMPVFSNIPKYTGPIIDKTHLLGIFGTCHHDMNISGIIKAIGAFNNERVLFIGEKPSGLSELNQTDFTGYLPADDVALSLQKIRFFILFDKRGISFRKGSTAAALANGIPIISNKTDWTDKHFQHGQNVCFFDGTVKGLVNAIKTCMTDNIFSDIIARGGKSLYDKHMKPEIIARKIVGILS